MSSSLLHHRGQMSEAFRTVMFLSASGGLQDAYTYIGRGKVFANAQTGNIVLMSQSLFEGDLARFCHYFVPVLSFALGVAAAECIRLRWRQARRIHWRQLVVLAEIVLLFAVGFFPAAWDIGANALVSFACAMQVQAFRKVEGYAFASTMCIGDLRSGVEALCIWSKTRDPKAKERFERYFGIIFLFALGAGVGSAAIGRVGAYTIWFSCVLLSVSFGLMFIREELEENPVIEKDLNSIRQEAKEIDHTLRRELQEEGKELRQGMDPHRKA